MKGSPRSRTPAHLLLWLAALGILVSLGRGCVPPPPCKEGTLDALGNDPSFGPCTLHCQCNNQNYEGYCQKPSGSQQDPNASGICVATRRDRCPKRGERRPCLFLQERRDPKFKCPWGAQICQPEGMKAQNWGDCSPFELSKEASTQASTKGLCADGFDNDCDGTVDLTDPKCVGACKPGAKEPCYTGKTGINQGICKAGTRTCSDEGEWGPCQGEILPKAREECNGIDDNCDGNIDEGLNGCDTTTLCSPGDTRACYTQRQGCTRSDGRFVCRGVCKAGTQTCQRGQTWGPCVGEVYPKDAQGQPLFVEKCDEKDGAPALDDNCNGAVNEGCLCQQPGATRPCYTGNPSDLQSKGLCTAGTQTCEKGQWSPCQGQRLPAFEECNGLDDDCDGKVDEDLPALPCPNQRGVCKGTTRICKAGHYPQCTPVDYKAGDPSYATKEDPQLHCDGKDNNCDGKIDEGCGCRAGEVKPCYTAKTGCTQSTANGPYRCQGGCKSGVQLCINGQLEASCRLQVTPSPEVCGDGIDNNCDGNVDEGCASGETKPEPPRREPPPGDGGPGEGSSGDASTRDQRPPEPSGRETPPTEPPAPCVGQRTRSCTTKLPGPCTRGVQVCQNQRWGPCAPLNPPKAEVCNGIDDDCDGTIDEASDLFGSFQLCTSPEQQHHTAHPQRYVVNPCSFALARCHNGKLSPKTQCTHADYLAHSADYQVKETRCDGIDNDCNGQIDEICPWNQSTSTALPKRIRVDAAGNIYLAASFVGRLTLGSFSLQSRLGCHSTLVAKIAPSGAYLWVTMAHGVVIQDIAISPNGASIYAVGGHEPSYSSCSQRFMQFGSISLDGSEIGPQGGSGGGGLYDAFVAKLDAAKGQWQWAFNFGGSGKDIANSVLSKANGAIYVTGSYQNTLSFSRTRLDIPPATRFSPKVKKTSTYYEELYVLKLQDHATRPKFVWWLQSEGDVGFMAGALRFDSKGQLLFSGVYGSSRPQVLPTNQGLKLGALALTSLNKVALTRSGSYDIFVAGLRDNGATGQFVWARTLGCTHSCEFNWMSNGNPRYPSFERTPSVSNFCVDSQDQLYLTGKFEGQWKIPGGATLDAKAQSWPFAAKLSAQGVLQWVRHIEGGSPTSFNSTGVSCLLSPNGKQLYVTGQINNALGGPPVKFGPKATEQRLGFGATDAFLVGYDSSNGALLPDMHILLGHNSQDYGHGLAWTQDAQKKRLLLWVLSGKITYGSAVISTSGSGMLQLSACPATGPLPQKRFCYR